MKEQLIQKQQFYSKNKHILDCAIKEKIEKAFDIEFTYNSTTIEGNTLNLVETKTVLEDKISMRTVSLEPG